MSAKTSTMRAATPVEGGNCARAKPKVISLPLVAPPDVNTGEEMAARVAAATLFSLLDALPFDDACRAHDLSPSTVRQVNADVGGLETFTVGRRIFVTKEAWQSWLAALQARGGVRLSGKRWAENRK